MRRSVAVALALTLLCLGLYLGLPGCGTPPVQLEPGSVVWGEVASVDGSNLDLLVGTMEDGTFSTTNGNVTVSIADASTVSDAGEALSPSDLVEGDVVRVTMGQEGASEVLVSRSPEVVAADQGEAATVVAEDGNRIGVPYESKERDESALRVEGGAPTFVDCKVDKSGNATDASKAALFGLDAAVLLRTGARATFDGGSITSSAEDGAALFAYDATATLNKTPLTTTRDDAPGLVATAGGTVDANGTTVATSGVGSYAVRSSARGTVRLAGGEFVTSGYDAPAVGCSSVVGAEGAKLTAAHSEALVLQGPAQASFTNCSIAAAMDANRGAHAPVNVQGVLLYQDGRRGDATQSLSLTGGSLTNNSGDFVFVTNTAADIRLEAVNVQNADPAAALLRVAANDGSLGWGEAGENGGAATLTCVNQRLSGDLVADAVSTLSVHLTEGSELTGAVTSEAKKGDAGTVEVVVDEGSTWRLTADCSITTLENHGTIVFGGHTLTLADGSVLGG